MTEHRNTTGFLGYTVFQDCPAPFLHLPPFFICPFPSDLAPHNNSNQQFKQNKPAWKAASEPTTEVASAKLARPIEPQQPHLWKLLRVERIQNFPVMCSNWSSVLSLAYPRRWGWWKDEILWSVHTRSHGSKWRWNHWCYHRRSGRGFTVLVRQGPSSHTNIHS